MISEPAARARHASLNFLNINRLYHYPNYSVKLSIKAAQRRCFSEHNEYHYFSPTL